MFRLFSNRPPLTTRQRVDLELLLRRTLEVIGQQRVLESRVVSDWRELSIDDSSAEATVQTASEALTKLMPIPKGPIEIEVMPGSKFRRPSDYVPEDESGPARIRLAGQTVEDPLRTTVELANQYSRHFWQHTPNPRELDLHPRTTHLLPVSCGLGILVGDASFYDQQWTQAGWAGWSMSRIGYYNASEVGYALALFARVRSESKPGWMSRLRLDSRSTMKSATRYFLDQQRQQRPLLFDAAEIPTSQAKQSDLANWLDGDDPSFALAAAYAMQRSEDVSPLAVESAERATVSLDVDIAQAATRVLGGTKSPSRDTIQLVEKLIRTGSQPVSVAAIQSADELGIPLDPFQDRIAQHLADFADESVALIEIVRRQGPRFRDLEPIICEHLADALEYSDQAVIATLIDCLDKITGDWRKSVELHIESSELRERAFENGTQV